MDSWYSKHSILEVLNYLAAVLSLTKLDTQGYMKSTAVCAMRTFRTKEENIIYLKQQTAFLKNLHIILIKKHD